MSKIESKHAKAYTSSVITFNDFTPPPVDKVHAPTKVKSWIRHFPLKLIGMRYTALFPYNVYTLKCLECEILIDASFKVQTTYEIKECKSHLINEFKLL